MHMYARAGACARPRSLRARAQMRALHKLANTDGHRDGTKYGLARTATRSFHTHHLRIISCSIVAAHAEMLLLAASVGAATALDARDDDLSGADGG